METSGWGDFANNLATDLAPLITLFSEQVTKQYLSESVGLLDTFIFALCPLGVLTAIVSAIRIAGSPALRAFVGRAQEGPGTAELELLSCTSETTAEMWNDGSISRVFGRPKILEIIVNENVEEYQLPIIEFLYEGMEVSRATRSPHVWSKSLGVEEVHNNSSDTEQLDHIFRSSNANLSLNKGIKRLADHWFFAAAMLGFMLVLGISAHLS